MTDLSVPTGGCVAGGHQCEPGAEGQEYGWRAGLAYEIPEYKLRAQILYRSGTQYGADGTLIVPGALRRLCRSPLVDLAGDWHRPTAAKRRTQAARSGVAPDWLVFGSVKWTDWSVLQSLDCHSRQFRPIVDQYSGGTAGPSPVASFIPSTTAFAGQASLTWDRGVSTGWDLRNEIWTLAVGGRVQANVGGEFRGGVGLSYLQSARKRSTPTPSSPATSTAASTRRPTAALPSTFNAGYIVQW